MDCSIRELVYPTALERLHPRGHSIRMMTDLPVIVSTVGRQPHTGVLVVSTTDVDVSDGVSLLLYTVGSVGEYDTSPV